MVHKAQPDDQIVLVGCRRKWPKDSFVLDGSTSTMRGWRLVRAPQEPF